MKKKIFFLIIVVSVFFSGIIIINNIFKYYYDIPENVSIIQYDERTYLKLNEVKFDSEQEIREISKYIKKIKLLKNDEKVKLVLLKQIEIKYGNDISVSIQLGETEYCYYTNIRDNESGIAMMPKGLYNLIEEKINY